MGNFISISLFVVTDKHKKDTKDINPGNILSKNEDMQEFSFEHRKP